ncbi:MAG: glycoside hydrolase family protein [Henriciella sp.]
MYFQIAPIPPSRGAVFPAGIDHPDLWLWDSWILDGTNNQFHLYCLALAKTDVDGSTILPSDRNDFTFHIRHFFSDNGGVAWTDQGPVMQSGQMADGSDARNVWSGSVLQVDDETIAFGFTGIRDSGPDRRYLQTVCVATGPSPAGPNTWSQTAISCPYRDYDEIREKGYYLGPRDMLGSDTGEEGGPIMAWRDPYLFKTENGELSAVWSAKVSPREPAIALAKLKRKGAEIKLAELCAPIRLPDSHLMTQAEVPKLYRDKVSGDFLLMVSACDRKYEGQPDGELSHIHRLYRSAQLDGSWICHQDEGSALPGLDGLFGCSLTDIDLINGHLTVLGPFTENAGPDKQLRFAPLRKVELASKTFKNVTEAI